MKGKCNIMEFYIQTSKREEIIDVTEKVRELVKGKKGKAVLVFVPHATAAIIANENYDPSVCEDILEALRKIALRGVWKHDRIDGNADAHIKASIVGASEVIPLEDDELVLGRWQNISLCDFDGPRRRKVIVKVLL